MIKAHESRRIEIRTVDGSSLPKGLLKRFDSDGDGKLSDDEKKAIAQRLSGVGQTRVSTKFDTDGDGKLSPQERKAAQSALRAQRAEKMRKESPR